MKKKPPSESDNRSAWFAAQWVSRTETSECKAGYYGDLRAEFIGTTFLLLAVVGSSLVAERTYAHHEGSALLIHALATSATLLGLLIAFERVEGPHFNPLSSIYGFIRKQATFRKSWEYTVIQFVGAVTGTALANLIFNEPVLALARRSRADTSGILAEFLCSFGLVMIIAGSSRTRPSYRAFSIAAFVCSTSLFSPSTSFCNPAVTFSRMFSDSIAGIFPFDAGVLILVQVLGAISACLLLPHVLDFPHAENRE